MYKYTIARQLATKKVITNRGDEVGKLSDLVVDEASGNIEGLLVELDKDSRVAKKINTRDKIVTVPYSAVTAVSDVFIVDEREMEHLEPEKH